MIDMPVVIVSPSNGMPTIHEFPVQNETDPLLGVPPDVQPLATQASEGNVLVQTDYNYADEFDVRGCKIMTMTAYFDGIARCAAYFASRDAAFVPERKYQQADPIEGGFGTNEAIEWDSMADVERGIKCTPITAAEEAVFRKFYPRGAIGTPMLPWESIDEDY